ncbi:penicillin-binding protein 1C [Pandoraea apista]|uniref:peptidoglycan glycosyltransferase n=2 Tax=Pandoraea apista TaxID=93218 RepID=A0ABX9ZS72_9BURK|nr:penicillin-binding protein 1C [Pandoraea apista]PTE02197.1 penicillin-binding protein 1C [Pandoraea apista]RRJ34634.1 penicillin-binding protein 1C [Pandoraea apista]RRJ80760.1 penicillin-binding protein 1C [Pandoraea apista]RSD07111.1 penicillin-binding protein 1C [Pandoraea apista]RSD17393.1 penicillin-binding protein 1C [Pandoraea apista]
MYQVPEVRRRGRVRWFLLSVGLALGLLQAPEPAFAVPSFDEVRQDWRASDWILLDRRGQPLQRLRADMQAQRGDWVTLADVSPAFRQALIISEDKRFYEHSGVDWRGVAAAAWGNLWHSRTRGASTLTMQLAGLLDDDLRPSARNRSVTQKIGQAATAVWLEQRWRKDQILEAYLNLVPFRGELVGISAVSQTLFGKLPIGLDARESALAVALLRAPNAAANKVAQRACGILRDMGQGADCTGLDGYAQLVFSRPANVMTTRDAVNLAPHFARRVFGASRPPAGTRIISTLDANLQRVAVTTLQQTLRELGTPGRSRNVQDGAIVVIDNASGDILAWVGSSGALSSAAQVDGVTSLRQAGSTLKPFLYAQAIAERRLTAASLLDDSPIDLPTGGGLYIPQNYDRHFKGWVSARTALGSSLNVPAVRTLVMVTPRRFAQTLVALGLPLTQSGDYYGYSLALGSADVTLLALTNAYRALANGGSASGVNDRMPDTARTRSVDKRKDSARIPAHTTVFSPQVSFIVADMIADRQARTRTFGLDSPLSTRYWTAVKTGTSKDMRDNWAVGFSRRYTVGVWVGNADGAPMWDVSGVSGAAPIWHRLMDYLHRRTSSLPPVPPPGLEHVAVQYAERVEPTREEWFLPGTSQSTIALSALATKAPGGPLWRIAGPADGTIVALDPDIPPANQRLWFQVAAAWPKGAAWRLDGKPLAGGARVGWLPWPGRHTLELVDAAGAVRDSIRFEVRGATLTDGKRMRNASR